MSRLIECDQCHRQVDAREVTGDGDPWPYITTATEDIDPVFCTWDCLGQWAIARALDGETV